MARAGDGTAALIDAKAVDAAYPLSGQVVLEPPMPLADALAERDGHFGIVADEALPVRLGLKPGDTVAIGTGTFVLRARLKTEPDKLAGGIARSVRAC